MRCVDEHSVHRFVHRPPPPNLDQANVELRSDWVRLALLAEHGGVWLDASIILLRPVEDCFSDDGDNSDLQGFAFPHSDEPILETWALAVRPDRTDFVQDWLREVETLLDEGAAAYCDRVVHQLPPKLQEEGQLPYLAAFAACCVVQRRWREQRGTANHPRLHLRPSEFDGGPYALHERCQWDSRRVMQTLGEVADGQPCRWMIKLRGGERRHLVWPDDVPPGAWTMAPTRDRRYTLHVASLQLRRVDRSVDVRPGSLLADLLQVRSVPMVVAMLPPVVLLLLFLWIRGRRRGGARSTVVNKKQCRRS